MYFGVYFGDQRVFVFCTGRRRSDSQNHTQVTANIFGVMVQRQRSLRLTPWLPCVRIHSGNNSKIVPLYP